MTPEDARRYKRDAVVLTSYPPRPGWRKLADGTVQWSGPVAAVPPPRPAPSREIGVRYDQGVRWGRFVGFEADDRGLLARVEFGDDGEPGDVVMIDRVVGLEGRPVAPTESLARGTRDLQVRIAALESGCERIADTLESSYAAEQLRELVSDGGRVR